MNVFSLPAASPASSLGLASPAGASSPLSSVFETSDPQTSPSNAPSFAQTLENAFGQANALQMHSAEMTQSFAQGKTSDIHSVMIASEQASLALQLTTQIRNKAVDAYQEIMRISM